MRGGFIRHGYLLCVALSWLNKEEDDSVFFFKTLIHKSKKYSDVLMMIFQHQFWKHLLTRKTSLRTAIGLFIHNRGDDNYDDNR